MEIINPGPKDYHMHSLNFSDGLPTINEIVHWAGVFGLKEIAITDHSQDAIEACNLAKKGHRGITKRWRNIHNDVEVIFGIEGDLLNEEGDICDHIQDKTSDFLILSMHDQVYQRDPQKLTEAYLRAMERHGDRIKFLGHPHIARGTEYLDMGVLTEAANKHGIPLEFNCRYLVNGGDAENLKIMLEKANRIYVNSDAHTLQELGSLRKVGFDFLRDNRYM